MKKILRTLSVSMMLLFFAQANYATHIVGGEMNYKCLGNDLYEMTLTIYRDCENGVPNFDSLAHIGVFDTNNQLIASIGNQGVLDIPYIEDDTLAPVLFNPCLVIPPNVCVDVTTYVFNVELPFLAGGYRIAYQRCCRNNTIVNIVNPGGTGATYTIDISEESLNLCNSSPTFREWPPVYICVNEPIIFDHGADDADGDSLVYSLCTPFLGGEQTSCMPPNIAVPCFDPLQPCGPQPCPPFNPPFQTIVWDPPYNTNDMLGGIPLSIDSETGLLTGTPNTIGQFVVGICMEEFRDGVLISTTKRDFQYNIGVCGTSTSAFFVPEVSCEGLEVDFENQSVLSNEFQWFFNDPNNPNATSDQNSPTFTYADTGTYTVMLIAEPNSATCADTSFGTFSVYESSLVTEFDFEILNCDDPFSISLIDMSLDTIFDITEWAWVINGSVFSSDQMPPVFTGDADDLPLTISLAIENDKRCEGTAEQTISVGTPLDYQNIIINCEPQGTANLSVNTLFPSDTVAITWEPAAAIISGQNSGTPLVDLTIANVFYFTAIDNDGCTYEDSIVVSNGGFDLMLNATADPDTIVSGTSSQLDVTGNDLTVYEWLPNPTLDDPTIRNPIATPEETTEYAVIVTDSNGCVDTATVLVVVITLDCEEPLIFMPNAFSPNGDGENDILYVEGNTIDEMELVIYNRWGEKVFESFDQNEGWNGYYNDELLEPDVYGYYLKILCFNGDEFFKKGNINLIR